MYSHNWWRTLMRHYTLRISFWKRLAALYGWLKEVWWCLLLVLIWVFYSIFQIIYNAYGYEKGIYVTMVHPMTFSRFIERMGRDMGMFAYVSKTTHYMLQHELTECYENGFFESIDGGFYWSWIMKTTVPASYTIYQWIIVLNCVFVFFYLYFCILSYFS